MKYLITSDLHITDNPRDEYRFDIFPWLEDMAKHNAVDYLFILGDLTDRKDNHSSKLVNKLVEHLGQLSAAVPTMLLAGNHDYIDKDCPFFKFLNALPNFQFLTGFAEFSTGKENLLFLSHTRTPTEDWKDVDWQEFDYVFMHQTMDGAKASTGMALDGLSRKIFRGFEGTIISGDIHVPQDVGPVTYVGSPYHVHFGDHFTPRCLLIDEGKMEDLHFGSAPRKLTYEIKDPEELAQLDFTSSDQLKVRLKLGAADLADWSVLKGRVEEICKERDTYLHAVELIKVNSGSKSKTHAKGFTPNLSHGEAYERFCKKEGIKGSIKEIGQALLD